ncbi:flagellar motor switch protein FliN [Conexibacter sp. JD483]|uniref:flagellar motor switch protein FliN n=1 Tax=unclassified Conexibacter TaxID=2627773 RepID=UPI0027236CA9|nr:MULTISPECIES: flagellar motor switch protein FliN [unclassified Conexibacter]MDO8188205.1 flagellar motor switch protein FliN [Conexibacter sp. CPCC 205706]MDO8201831.1 flagellar motor switch protein FliN [Conexibacter sp. CPCC 205762]MDR9372890.1 flagellar motor switch protein FliN [Conexibacter sp. JD483]
MSQEIQLPAFDRPVGGSARSVHNNDLGRLSDVPVELAVEIGRTRMTVGETLELRPGSIVVLNRMAGEPVDLLVNGTPIAHGEVVVIDEEFGLRITDVLGGDNAGEGASDDASDGAADAAAEAPGTV